MLCRDLGQRYYLIGVQSTGPFIAVCFHRSIGHHQVGARIKFMQLGESEVLWTAVAGIFDVGFDYYFFVRVKTHELRDPQINRQGRANFRSVNSSIIFFSWKIAMRFFFLASLLLLWPW
jgi:hypothetical protein